MALQSKIKSAQKTPEEISELLDQLGKLIERTKVMYEQYFMGIQKMAPMQLHRDIERRIRELTQNQIRNTALRFRLATLTQKFGSYNTYWKRTMRQIERGEYVRDVARAGRRMRRKGEELPDELLVKLPKRMRDRILRDREAVAKREKARQKREGVNTADAVAQPNSRGVFELDDGDGDLDLDAIFRELEETSPSTGDDTVETRAAPAPSGPDPVGDVAPPPQPSRPPVAARSRPAPRKPAPRPQPQAKAKPAPAPAPTPPAGMSEPESRALFDRYSKARKLVGDARPVTYDQLMRKLGKQAPKIMAEHNAKSVDFSVVIKGDKVVLKAKPK